MHDKILKLISSLPIILISLYFLPVLGVFLLILRLFTYRERKYSTSIIMILLAVFLIIPKCIGILSSKLNFNLGSKFDNILASELYSISLIDYSKRLFIFGVIFLIIMMLFRRISENVGSKILNYINKYETENREIREKNDLIMQEKREKAKNTSFVLCPYCGGDNILTGPTGTCKFCRRTLEAKKEK